MMIRILNRFGLSSVFRLSSALLLGPLFLGSLWLCSTACSERLEPPSASAPAKETVSPPLIEERGPLVIFLGDSLTAGYGLSAEQAYPALIEAYLNETGQQVRVVNAGISGDTTAGGLARLDWLLRQQPDILVVCLGANDGLRGVPLDSSEVNLRSIVEQAQAQDIQVLLAGMLIPPNYGPDYAERFAAIYPRLAKEFDVPLIPFLLEGVAAHPELNLPDGIHPTAEGQRIVAETVLPFLAPLVESISTQ